MLFYIASMLQQYFGPLRLLQSNTILIIIALYAGFFVTMLLTPKAFAQLPKDRGKEFSVGGNIAIGKPTGAGLVFITVFLFLALLITPMNNSQLAILLLTWLVMLTGFLDDKSTKPWGELKKGVLDFLLSVTTAFALYYLRDGLFWLPFVTGTIDCHPAIYITLTTIILWVSINTTNCSDGVDGLSGSLVLIALIFLGALFYFVQGHSQIAEYLLVPHLKDGAQWAVIIFALCGCLMGYLWHNAFPSKCLMGDAGSRALGFIIGVCVMISGNPFLLFLTSSVLLVNGGTGLVKVALLRFFKIKIFSNVRFPLHDHMKKTLEWSPTQILLKFVIIQILVSLAMLGIIFKIR